MSSNWSQTGLRQKSCPQIGLKLVSNQATKIKLVSNWSQIGLKLGSNEASTRPGGSCVKLQHVFLFLFLY